MNKLNRHTTKMGMRDSQDYTINVIDAHDLTVNGKEYVDILATTPTLGSNQRQFYTLTEFTSKNWRENETEGSFQIINRKFYSQATKSVKTRAYPPHH